MEESQVIEKLKALNQQNILNKFATANETQKKHLINQINQLEKSYNGGIAAYIKKAKELLEYSRNGLNPLLDYKASIPEGYKVDIGSNDFYELESKGFDLIKDTIFCLVAGGLGERLGYPDIKISIETDLITKRRYIEIYIQYILAYENKLRKKFNLPNDWNIPLIIMTSDDTHIRTVELLKKYNNFGLKEEQVFIIKQEKCAALADLEGNLAFDEENYEIITKPHGHGDVHKLLYESGIIKNLYEKGKKHLIFFQDTNALIFNIVPSSLMVNEKLNLDCNIIAVYRKPGDPLCGICGLTDKDSNHKTLCIKYNVLDSFLKQKYNGQGDMPNKEGYSDFPGNTNILVFRLDPYYKALCESKGVVPEFINPKYTDKTMTKFVSPTRIECEMQDFPRLFTNEQRTGFTLYENWVCFTTCKNSLDVAIEKMGKGLMAEGAFSVEQDLFIFYNKVLDILKVLEVDDKDGKKFQDVEVKGKKFSFGPKILIYPSFAANLCELKEKLKDIKIKVTGNSTLIIKGDFDIKSDINLDGFLEVTEEIKEKINVNNKKIYDYETLKEGEGEIYEKIRGYKLHIKEN